MTDLKRALREPHDEARAHRNWEAITRRRYPTPKLGARFAMGSALVLGLGVAVALVTLALPHAPGPLVRENGARAQGMLDQREIALDDGSVITLEDGARLEVLENTGDHVRFWLHEGVAHFDVVPGGPRRWAIETGLVTVEVLGTAFSVARTVESVTVAVARGSVLVRGPTAPDGMRRLGAGESLTLPAGEQPTVARVESAPAPAEATPEARARPHAHETVAPIENEDEDEDEIEAAAPRLRDVDALRAAGRIDEAVTLLDAISNDPTAGRERALAAFTRARLELDRRGRPSDAAAAFDRAIALGLREPLREDAEARRVEALARASDTDGARRAADDYRAHHPNGRWLADVERWSATH